MPASSPATGPRTRLGGALLVLGTVQFFLMHVIAQSAWTAPRYSVWNNYISDLGAIHCAPVLGNYVCSPLHTGMNASFVLQGVLLLAGVSLTTGAWSTLGRSRVWRGMAGIAGLSWVIVGLVPEDVNLTGHSIGALPIFILGNIALVVAGTSASTRNRPAVHLLALFLGIAGLLGFALTAVATANPGGPLGIGFAERITVFPLQIWALAAGISILHHPNPSPVREDGGHSWLSTLRRKSSTVSRNSSGSSTNGM